MLLSASAIPAYENIRQHTSLAEATGRSCEFLALIMYVLNYAMACKYSSRNKTANSNYMQLVIVYYSYLLLHICETNL